MKNHTLTEQFLSRTLSRRNFKKIPKSGDSKDPCNDLSRYSQFFLISLYAYVNYLCM